MHSLGDNALHAFNCIRASKVIQGSLKITPFGFFF